MKFKHIRMINSASKCLKITLKLLNFQNQKKKIPKKLKLRGDIPLESFEGGLIPRPPLAETLPLISDA
jgi:hypothetical protein